MVHCRRGDAGDVYGSAGHVDCGGSAAVHRGERLGDERRSHVGADKLPSGECDCAAGERMVREEIRAQEFPGDLHHYFHDFVVCVRCGDESADASGCAGGSGSRRRRAAAAFSGDSAGEFSGGKARAGDGGVWIRRGGGASAGTNVGRMDHGELQLAVGVLHQYSDWDSGGDFDFAPGGGPEIYSRGGGGEAGCDRAGFAGRVARRAADNFG